MEFMTRPSFVNNSLYHIFNRGVEKRSIFIENKDYYRFLFDMKEFNDVNSTINILRRLNEGNPISFRRIEKDCLVKIIAYCLMPNHFHFILKQLKNNGTSRFMQKLGIGYTNYFNKKYERSGVLFQGKFKAVLIDKNNYLNYLIQYIYLNPLELIEPNWKEDGLKNYRRAKDFLNSYKWTNCNNYNEYFALFKDYKPQYFVQLKDLTLD
jgi:putative transposase